MPNTLDLQSAQALATGAVINSVTLPATTMTQMVYYCAAARVFDPIHFDREFAREHGFPDAIVNGSLRVAWMAQILCDILTLPDRIVELSCSHHGLVPVGQSVTIEARAAGALERCDAGWLLPVEVESSVESTVVDRAKGRIFLTQS